MTDKPVWPDDYIIPGIEPYHVEEAGIIYCADCRDILPHLPKVDSGDPVGGTMIRVFPRRTKWTPTDDLAFVGDPPLFLPPEMPVRVSVAFTWDKPEGERLFRAWKKYYSDVKIGGPAYDDPGEEFEPGQFIKPGVTITSRGCIRKCSFCLVPRREGKIRELIIRDGHIVQDNNLLACSERHIHSVFNMLACQVNPAELMGLDARLLKSWHVDLIKSIRLKKLWIAYDSFKQEKAFCRAANLLADIPQAKKFCYVLIGYDGESIADAEWRLWQVYKSGFMPFAQLYQGPNGEGHQSKEWKQFQRTWCRPAAYKALLKSEVTDD